MLKINKRTKMGTCLNFIGNKIYNIQEYIIILQ